MTLGFLIDFTLTGKKLLAVLPLDELLLLLDPRLSSGVLAATLDSVGLGGSEAAGLGGSDSETTRGGRKGAFWTAGAADTFGTAVATGTDTFGTAVATGTDTFGTVVATVATGTDTFGACDCSTVASGITERDDAGPANEAGTTFTNGFDLRNLLVTTTVLVVDSGAAT